MMTHLGGPGRLNKIPASLSGLSAPERVRLFCVASATVWQRAGMTYIVARQLVVRAPLACRG